MQEHSHTIRVRPGTDITALWAMPDRFVPGQSDAIILAHGAGNDMHHPFMRCFHRAFARAGLLSVTFNFPYTESGRKAPDRPAVLEQTWVAVASAVRHHPSWRPGRLLLGGKSMGSRMASLAVAHGLPCDGLVFLGYPLHPARQPDRIRTGHWPDIHCPALFLPGTRDALCDLDLLQAQLPQLAGPAALKIVAGGDHGFKVPKVLGLEQDSVYRGMIRATLDWMDRLPR